MLAILRLVLTKCALYLFHLLTAYIRYSSSHYFYPSRPAFKSSGAEFVRPSNAQPDFGLHRRFTQRTQTGVASEQPEVGLCLYHTIFSILPRCFELNVEHFISQLINAVTNNYHQARSQQPVYPNPALLPYQPAGNMPCM